MAERKKNDYDSDKNNDKTMTYSHNIGIDLGYDYHRRNAQNFTNNSDNQWSKQRNYYNNSGNDDFDSSMADFSASCPGDSSSHRPMYNYSKSESGFGSAMAMANNGNSMSVPQSTRTSGYPSNANANIDFQQITTDALNVSLDTVHASGAMSNFSLSRFRNPMLLPDMNSSSTLMSSRFHDNYDSSTNSNLIAHNQHNDNNAFGESSASTLNGVARAMEQYFSRQSGIEQNALSMRNATASLINNRKRAGDGSDSPTTKRMKQMQANQDRQFDQSNQGTSRLWRDVNGISYPLFNESDERNLSQYQCLARKQMEIFEATADAAGNNAQGRNKPILPGQIGIRCIHCYKLAAKQRKTGSVYYPNRLEGVYQTAQKMTVGHLIKHCTKIPREIRERLIFLKDQKSSDGGGKRYWANGVRMLGVVETFDGLAFEKSPSYRQLKNAENNNNINGEGGISL